MDPASVQGVKPRRPSLRLFCGESAVVLGVADLLCGRVGPRARWVPSAHRTPSYLRQPRRCALVGSLALSREPGSTKRPQRKQRAEGRRAARTALLLGGNRNPARTSTMRLPPSRQGLPPIACQGLNRSRHFTIGILQACRCCGNLSCGYTGIVGAGTSAYRTTATLRVTWTSPIRSSRK